MAVRTERGATTLRKQQQHCSLPGCLFAEKQQLLLHRLRGNKGGTFEGGVRGSGFVWGKLITADKGGRLWRGLSHVVDWWATIVHAAGGKIPPIKDS